MYWIGLRIQKLDNVLAIFNALFDLIPKINTPHTCERAQSSMESQRSWRRCANTFQKINVDVRTSISRINGYKSRRRGPTDYAAWHNITSLARKNSLLLKQPPHYLWCNPDSQRLLWNCITAPRTSGKSDPAIIGSDDFSREIYEVSSHYAIWNGI